MPLALTEGRGFPATDWSTFCRYLAIAPWVLRGVASQGLNEKPVAPRALKDLRRNGLFESEVPSQDMLVAIALQSPSFCLMTLLPQKPADLIGRGLE